MTGWDSASSAAKGADVTEFSKDQLDKLRDKLDGAGVKPKCLACQRGTMVLYRGQVGIVELGEPVHGVAPGQTACLMRGEAAIGFATIAPPRPAPSPTEKPEREQRTTGCIETFFRAPNAG